MGFVACGPHPRTGLGVVEERQRGVRWAGLGGFDATLMGMACLCGW